MLLPFLLLAAAPALDSVPQPEPKPPAVRSMPASKPQAEAVLVAKFNQLVAARKEFSAVYKGSHVVDARKARAVRKAWLEFQLAQTQYNEYTHTHK